MRREKKKMERKKRTWAERKEQLAKICEPSIQACMNCNYRDCIRPEGGLLSDIKMDMYIRMKDGIPMTEDHKPRKRRRKISRDMIRG